MRREHLSVLRCPACRGTLELEAQRDDAGEVHEGALRCSCGERWEIRDGIAGFTYPVQLKPSDEELQKRYDDGAERYDDGLEWLFRSFHEDQDAVREKLVDLLELSSGATVLDLGGGTGSDSLHITRRLGSAGRLFLLDLSSGMLRIARSKLGKPQPIVEYLLGNGTHLPFADRTFDAVFHFGGINEFAEIPRTFVEMTRVTRVGGKVVVGDESVAPWLRRKTFGRILSNANPLYKHRPPLGALPVEARDVGLRWILGNAFYVIDYRVGEGSPPLDLDLPIPGKGDSLRSRYDGAKSRSVKDHDPPETG